MKLEILQGDITELDVDVIVNAANRSLRGGGGVDGAIHRKAGAELLEECIVLGGCETGDAKVTKGYNLKAKHIIHTVGPVFFNGNDGEDELLTSCYMKSLQLAEDLGYQSIAFPCISTGVYDFPSDRAAKIAVETVRAFKSNNIEKVIFCCFLNKDFDIYTKLLYN
jgi:O-acetyl-ADP-ribose deacetylase (regulator of RNase III)